MINCYKILEIPLFSSKSEVKKAYRKLAKKYHPDTNSGFSNPQKFADITKAYDILNDTKTKNWYDKKLHKENNNTSTKTSKAKRKPFSYKITKDELVELATRSRRKDIYIYELNNKKFPFKHRLYISIIGILISLNIVYSNWFVLKNSLMFFWLVAGVTLFLFSVVQLLGITYKQGRVRHLKTRRNPNFNKKSVALFLSILFLYPMLLTILNNNKKAYHLKHFPVEATAKIESAKSGYLTFSFKDKNGKLYVKKTSLKEASLYRFQKNIPIIYSEQDPKIVILNLNN